MSTFFQIHQLTVMPLSNANRDDQGRPKTASFGGHPRLRLSSQSIKRAIRTSTDFSEALSGHLGKRTRMLGEKISQHLAGKGAPEEDADAIAAKIVAAFGSVDESKNKKSGVVRTQQLGFFSPDEIARAIQLAERAWAGETMSEDLKALRKEVLATADTAADIAMFGRMLADAPEYNRDAAVQVNHPITTHRAVVEDDYFSAVDDLKTRDEDSGAGFISEAHFGSGVFYLYTCVNCDLLVENLGGDRELAEKAIVAFVESVPLATPTGKQNSFAHHPRAGFIRAEVGPEQPRDLSAAFFRPVKGEDLMQASIDALRETAAKFDAAYGGPAREPVEMSVFEGQGALTDIVGAARRAIAATKAREAVA